MPLPRYPAHLANDGWSRDTDSYWATDVTIDKAAWWQVDLENRPAIGRVVVVFYYGDRRSYGFTVETSLDGKQWDHGSRSARQQGGIDRPRDHLPVFATPDTLSSCDGDAQFRQHGAAPG